MAQSTKDIGSKFIVKQRQTISHILLFVIISYKEVVQVLKKSFDIFFQLQRHTCLWVVHGIAAPLEGNGDVFNVFERWRRVSNPIRPL